MKFLAARRRSPLVASALLLGALAVVGGGYAAVASVQPAEAAIAVGTDDPGRGGARSSTSRAAPPATASNAAGHRRPDPTLVGVGAAAVDFQVGTGRMPLAAPGAQAPRKATVYTEEEIDALAAYIASLAPGPAIPTAEQLDYDATPTSRTAASCSAPTAPRATTSPARAARCPRASTPRTSMSSSSHGTSTRRCSPARRTCRSSPTRSCRPEEKQAIIAYIKALQQAPRPRRPRASAARPGHRGPVRLDSSCSPP